MSIAGVRQAVLWLVAGVILTAFPAVGWTHESRPVYVEIQETAPDAYLVRWRVPPSVPRFNIPAPVLPSVCAPRGPEVTANLPGAIVSQRRYRCPGGLAGQEAGIRFPVLNPSVTTLFRVYLLSGETHTKLLSPKDTSWRIPERETTWGVAREYAVLGIRHILGGYDHLLFLACLVLIAGTGRRILITITGFTLAHSVTLALAALDVVRVPVPPVEATIALSIVFLATEIARDRRDTLTWRFPITVSASFGLLHGFGFAAVLKEIGLPQTEIPAALMFFNVGVEIGQILFVLVIVGAMAALGAFKRKRRRPRTGIVPRALARPAAYVVGGLAVFWMAERVSGFWA